MMKSTAKKPKIRLPERVEVARRDAAVLAIAERARAVDGDRVWWKTAVLAELAALATETGFPGCEIKATLQAPAWWSDNGRGITLSPSVVCEQPAHTELG